MLIVVLWMELYSFIPSNFRHMHLEVNLGRLGKSMSRSFRIFIILLFLLERAVLTPSVFAITIVCMV